MRDRSAFAPFVPRVLLVLALALAVSPASAQEPAGKAREWKLSTAVGPAFALGKAGARWAALIAESPEGKLAVRLFPGASIAQRDPARELAALRDGAADLAVGSSLFWSAEVNELNAIGLPWIVPEIGALEALATGAMKERFAAAVERAGVVPLAFAALGYRDIATTAKPLRSPADAAGMRIRVASPPLLNELFVALGAEPRAMTFGDAQEAFRTGMLDAQEGTPATFAAARLDALGIREVLLWGAVAEIAVFAVNRTVWNSCNDAQRALISDAAQQAARELRALVRSENEAALAELRKRGVAITRLTGAGRGAFAAETRGVYDKWANVAGPELVRAVESAVRGASAAPGPADALPAAQSPAEAGPTDLRGQ
jgi:TRAP-type C4-dicarboxylate transport system substrate-binding protein